MAKKGKYYWWYADVEELREKGLGFGYKQVSQLLWLWRWSKMCLHLNFLLAFAMCARKMREFLSILKGF